MLSPRWRSNSLLNVMYDFGRESNPLEFIRLSLLECNPAGTPPIIFIFLTPAFREKNGLVRNDFLDCMMELRKASKDEVQGDVQSAKNANIGVTFSKLQKNVILNEAGN